MCTPRRPSKPPVIGCREPGSSRRLRLPGARIVPISPSGVFNGGAGRRASPRPDEGSRAGARRSYARAMGILERIEQIYAIGAHRAGYSAEEDEAHRLAGAWMREAGLEVEADAARNLIGLRGAART